MGSENEMVAVPCARCGADRDGHIDRIDARPGQCDEWIARLAPAQPDAQQGEGLPDRFEVWWATYKHRNRDEAGYAIKKVIAFDAYQAAAMRTPQTVRVTRHEDYSGEHREWTEEVALTTPSSPALDAATIERCIHILRGNSLAGPFPEARMQRDADIAILETLL